MKIAIYVPTWPAGASANGIVTYAKYLVPALRRQGHEVFVLTFNNLNNHADPYLVDLKGVVSRNRLLRRILRKFFPLAYFHIDVGSKISYALRALRAETKIDVFEIEETFGWAAEVSEACDVPVVVRLHGPWIINGQTSSEKSSDYSRRVRREGRGILASAFVTAASKFVLDSVQAKYSVGGEKSCVIMNPIEPSSEHWELEGCDKNRLLYVGRFDRAKGADLVLSAFAILAERYPGLCLTFVGPDRGIYEPSNGALLNFQDYVETHVPEGVRKRIEFRGQLPHQVVMDLRKTHFLSIVASRFEILPYSIIEAMALGCPIVASAVGGIPELIESGENGLLFEKESVRGLVDSCSRFLNDHIYAKNLALNARISCKARLNPDDIAAATVSIYEQAIMRFYAGRR